MKHWKRKTIAVTKLLLDRENPRHPMFASQREILSHLATNERSKMYSLADRLAKHGMDPTDLPLVVPHPDEQNTYIAIDGNRRVAALKLMATPNLAPTEGGKRRFKHIAAQLEQPIRRIEVVIAQNREECLSSLKTKHYGENKGIGRVSWNAEEQARFDERNQNPNRYHLALWALDLVRESRKLPLEVTNNVPLSSLERMLQDQVVRKLLGFDLEKQNVLMHLSHDEILKGLARIVSDLGTGKIRVDGIKIKKHRKNYMDNLDASDRPNQQQRLTNPIQVMLGATSGTGEQNKQPAQPRALNKPRSTLIPSNTEIIIAHPRIVSIYNELRKLQFDKFPNSIAALFRVFIEISCDEFIDTNKLNLSKSTQRKPTLKAKVEAVSQHLIAQGQLTKAAAKPIQKAVNTDNHLLSIDTLHAYIHSREHMPVPIDLRGFWDSYQAFIVALWAK